MAILNPVAWSWEHLRQTTASLSGSRPEEYWPGQAASDTGPRIRRVGTRALRNALADGWDDFAANRTDLIMMALIYPALGLLLSRLAWGHDMLPLIFPLASGFALIGPFAAIGLMEMSRQREIERPMPWSASFSVFRSPASTAPRPMSTAPRPWRTISTACSATSRGWTSRSATR